MHRKMRLLRNDANVEGHKHTSLIITFCLQESRSAHVRTLRASSAPNRNDRHQSSASSIILRIGFFPLLAACSGLCLCGMLLVGAHTTQPLLDIFRTDRLSDGRAR